MRLLLLFYLSYSCIYNYTYAATSDTLNKRPLDRPNVNTVINTGPGNAAGRDMFITNGMPLEKALELQDRALSAEQKMIQNEKASKKTIDDLQRLIKQLNDENLQKRIGELEKQGNYDELIEVCKKELVQRGKNRAALGFYLIGWYYQQQEKYDDALINYKEAVKLQPDTSACYAALANVHYMRSEFDEALKWYIKSYELDSILYLHDKTIDIGNDCANVSDIYRWLGNSKEAKHWVSKAIAIDSLKPDKPGYLADDYIMLSYIYLDEARDLRSFDMLKNALVYENTVTDTVKIRLYYTAAVNFLKVGNADTAAAYAEKYYALVNSLYPKSKWFEAYVYSLKADIAFARADYDTAIKNYLLAKDIYLHFFKSTPDLLRIYSNLSFTYGTAGQHKEAEEYFKLSLDEAKSVYGDTSRYVMRCYKWWGNMLINKGKCEDGLIALKRALKINEALPGNNYDAIEILNSIGWAYHSMWNYKEAEQYYLKAITLAEKVAGPDNPAYRFIYVNLADIYNIFGDYELELKYRLHAWKAESGNGVRNNNARAANAAALGWVYRRTRQLNEALHYYEIACGYLKKDLPDSLFIMNFINTNYALTLSDLGRHDTALAIFMHQYEYLNRYPDYFMFYKAELFTYIGYELERLNMQAEALEWFKKTVSADIAAQLRPDTYTAMHYSNLGAMYSFLGYHDKAKSAYLEQLKHEKTFLSSTDTFIAKTCIKIAGTYQALDNAEALKYYKRAMAIYTKVYGKVNEPCAQIWYYMGHTYSKISAAKAFKCYKTAYDIDCKLYSPRSVPATFDVNAMGDALMNMHKYKDALRYYDEALNNCNFIEVSETDLFYFRNERSAAFNKVHGIVYENPNVPPFQPDE